MLRIIVCILCILASISNAAGQKVTIYFKSGSWKISAAEQKKLDLFIEQNVFSSFDTLSLNGYAI